MIRIHYFHPKATAPVHKYYMDFEDIEMDRAIKFFEGLAYRGFYTKKDIRPGVPMA